MACLRNNILKRTLNQIGICNQHALFTTQARPKTGIVMLNMGGPADPKDTGPFLSNLFNDPEIITLGGGKFQEIVANYIVKKRTPKITQQYEEIGGSPILKYTQLQGNEMCNILDKLSPSTAPHKPYVMFRYVNPLTEETLLNMKNDGIKHAIAFSQYPQWCCNTTGSSMNHLWRELDRLNMKNEFKWSIIDRWYNNNGYINALSDKIEQSLINQFTQTQRQNEDIMILFSAHSLPMKSVTKGDAYVFEVSATVHNVMQRFRERIANGDIVIDGMNSNNLPRYQLTWQSKVGYLPWMVPSTENVIKSIGKTQRYQNVLVVPFVFTSDHIETLYELDIEYAEEAKKVGIKNYVRCPALNESPVFINGLANIVHEHIQKQENYSSQYKLRCHDCTNDMCRTIYNPMYSMDNNNNSNNNNTNENIKVEDTQQQQTKEAHAK